MFGKAKRHNNYVMHMKMYDACIFTQIVFKPIFRPIFGLRLDHLMLQKFKITWFNFVRGTLEEL